MPREIIITSTGVSEAWSRQYCRREGWAITLGNSIGRTVASQARGMEVISRDTRAGVVAAFASAARAAGRGGKILYSHGHGNGVRDGAVIQFTETPEFRVGAENIAHQVVQPGVTINYPNDPDFERIGTILRQAGISEVIFLVCGIGANQNFMQIVKTGWGGGITIRAYADGVALQMDQNPVAFSGSSAQNNLASTYPRARLYLWRDGADPARPGAYGTGTSSVPLSWLELPAGLVSV